MKRPENIRNRMRGIGFEAFEDRLALSAQPIGEFALDALEVHPIEAFGAAVTQAAEGHGWNEVAYARDQFGLHGSRQTVAIIDSGIAYDHLALGGGFGAADRVVGGWDFAENDADPYDDGPAGFHGTHVAGIVGSSDAKYTGVANGVDLVALRVFDDQGNGQMNWVEAALQWVHDHRNSFENPITTINLSLGTDWNSIGSLPTWATLENEFAQLESDGIFIAVAAGNSFLTYNAAGLSYPAVSQYVVPVASVGASGNLSSFSQRSDRVLAAPGERIMSTLPDAFYGGDGYKNDFGAASGTSMATPYIAGASVLVREAMQNLGYTGINEDAIYDELRSTADLVWDAATQANYRRINLQRALDTLVGADDFGSSADNAFSLGTLGSSTAFAGTIGRLSDQDYFQFTAAASGTVTFTARTTSGELAAAWQNAGASAKLDGNQITLTVQAGQTYSVGLGTSAGIGKYALDVQVVQAAPTPVAPPSAVNWGTVEFARINAVPLAAGEGWFQVTASRSGIFTVEALAGQSGGKVQLDVYDAQQKPVSGSNLSGTSSASGGRVDFDATAGGTYFVRARGVAGKVDFRLTNLVTVAGGNVNVAGTAAADSFTWTAGTKQQIAVNDVQYAMANITSVQFQGGAGSDSITLVGGAAAEAVTLSVGSVDLSAMSYRVSAGSVETIRVYGGAGDRAVLFDSTGSDFLQATPAWTRLTGAGFENYVSGMSTVRAYSSGGNDLARMYGSAGDDTFTVSGGSRIVSGTDYSLRSENFQCVQFDGRGGFDRVELLNLVASDELYGRRSYGRLTSGEFKTEISNVDAILVQARLGASTRSDVRTVDYVFQKLGR
jgi:subtilisin family serine protease